MTFNTTLRTLHDNRRLRLWRPLNRAGVQRYIFLMTIADRFIDALATEPARGPGRRSRTPPYDQVAGLLDRLAEGESLDRLVISGMTPPAKRLTGSLKRLCVWELRVTDTRVFGWCLRPGVFIAVQCADAARLHAVTGDGFGSHAAHARSVHKWRQAAGFTRQHVWDGDDLNAFLARPGRPPLQSLARPE